MKVAVFRFDRHPIADLRRPFKTRHRVDSDVAGRIELAYERGYHAGLEDGRKQRKRKRKR